MFASRFYRRTREAALASALFLALGSAAYASPGFGHGGAHGPGGPGARGAHVEQVIAQLKSQLNLDTSQQVAFDNAVAAAKAAREATRTEHEKVRAAVQAELASAAPDLAKIAGLADQAQAANQAQRRQVRDQWLQLYATFRPEQKLVVRDAMAKRMERMEGIRSKIRAHRGS